MPFVSTQPPYPEKFKPGDIAISLTEVEFCDGTKHEEGEEILVTFKNASYYNVWHHIYAKKGIA